MMASCMHRITEAALVFGQRGTKALIERVEGAYSGPDQPYTVLLNISSTGAPWRITHPFLGTGPEEGADQILGTFWVLDPLEAGETPKAKGPNVLAAAAAGTLQRPFACQGEFSTTAGELVQGVRKSYMSVLLPSNGPGSPLLPPEIIALCGFDEHTVVDACDEV